MLSGEFLDHLSDVVNNIRNYGHNEVAFAGIQLIFCGDFLQLPPIHKKPYDINAILSSTQYEKDEIHRDKGFAFQSNVWKMRNLKVIQLCHIFRQNNKEFQEILSKIRQGEVSLETEQFLQRCNRPLPVINGIKPTILYPRNVDVSEENRKELARIPDTLRVYNAEDDIHVDPDANEGAYAKLANSSFFNDCIAERMLQLKTNAQVMLIKNETGTEPKHRLVNGSRGVVSGFVNEDKCTRDLNDHLQVNSSEDIVSDNLEASLPVVRFRCGRRKVIEREDFTFELSGVGRCVRHAIPLKLAWAITVHKAQGMSIDYVKADVSKVFGEAQTYVALSRATDVNGLELRGFEPKKVKVESRAKAFYSDPHGSFPHWDEDWTQAEE